MTPLAESLARSPELFPLFLDLASDRITFARLTEEDYVRASFLDNRLEKPKLAGSLTFRELYNAVAETDLASDFQFICHISHVGSTLMSRLIGAHPEMFALRQPGILRPLTYTYLESTKAAPQWRGKQFNARFLVFLKLWSRTFHHSQHAVIKVPSFVCELAKLMFAQPCKPKAIFIFAAPERHLANILRSQHSVREAHGLATMRLLRLNNRLGTQFSQKLMTTGEIVAMSWASEMTAMMEAAADVREQVLWFNFDEFLATPQPLLSLCFSHLGIAASADQIDSILNGPDMRRHSKTTTQQYTANDRDNEINESQQKFGDEIQGGLRWLENAASHSRVLKSAIDLSF
jgi:hypothetical protein